MVEEDLFEVKTVEPPKKRKAVRRKMLKKLMKYEYKALFKFLIPFYAVILVLAGLDAVLMNLFLTNTIESPLSEKAITSAFSSVSIVYASCAVVGAGVCFVNIMIRFYKNLFTDEGYLTLSIPASAEEHIFAKSLSAFVCTVLTGFVTVLSLAILLIPTAEDFWFDFIGIEFLFEELSTAEIVLYIFEIVVLSLVSLMSELHIVYTCICLGQLFPSKNKVARACVFIAVYVVLSEIFTVFASGFDLIDSFMESVNPHLGLWILILIGVGLTAILFLIERTILKKKINLS